MITHTMETSPQVYARTGRMLYLIIIVVGLIGQTFVRGRLILWLLLKGVNVPRWEQRALASTS